MKISELTMSALRLVVLAAIPLAGLFAGMVPSGVIGLQDDDAEATIRALETEVADLQTQVATLAPAPTPTQGPQPTVPTEPQPLTDGLELLYYYTIDDGSSVTLLGEVRNTTEQRLDSPYLEFTLLDPDGNIVGTTNASAVLVTIGPGEVMPFETTIYDIPRDEWASEEIAVCDWPSDFYVEEGYGISPTLQLQDIEEVEKSADRLEVDGKVLNSGDTPTEGVEVIAFVYLPDGRYAGHASSRIDVAIPPSKTARFSLDAGSYSIPGLDLLEGGDDYTYQLWVGTEPGARVYMC